MPVLRGLTETEALALVLPAGTSEVTTRGEKGPSGYTPGRWRHAKTYLLPPDPANPGALRHRMHIGRDVHYEDDGGNWRTIDLNWQADPANPGEFVTERNDIHTRVSRFGVAVWDRKRRVGLRWITAHTPIVSGRQASFPKDGLTWTWGTTTSGLKLESEPVISPRGPKTYEWRYRLIDLNRTNPDLLGTLSVDAGGNLVGDGFVTPRAYAIGANGLRYDCGKWQAVTGKTRAVAFTFDDSTLPPAAFPYVIDPTTTFNVAASGDDGLVGRYGSTYPPTTNYASAAGTNAGPERSFSSPTYAIYQALMQWDTSAVPDTATINGATLRVYVLGKVNTNGLSVVVGWINPALWPIDATDYAATPETNAHAGTPIASVTAGVYNFVLANAAANVSVTGYTAVRMALSDGTPTGNNYVTFAFFDDTTFAEPSLIIDYTISLFVEDAAFFSDEVEFPIVPDPAFLEIVAPGINEGLGPTPPQPGPPDQGFIPNPAAMLIGAHDPQPTGGVPVNFVVAQPAGIYVNSPSDDGTIAVIGVNATSDWLLDPGTDAYQYGTGYTQGTRFRLSGALTVTAIGLRNADWMTKNHTFTIWDTTTTSAIASIVGTTVYDGWYWFTLPSSVNLVATREYILTWYDASAAVMSYETSRTANTWLPAMTVAGILMEVQTGEYYTSGAAYPITHNPDGTVFAMGLRGTATGGAGPSTVTPPPAATTTIAPAPTVVASTPALSVTPATAPTTATVPTPSTVAGPVTLTPATAIATTTAATPIVTAGVAPQTVTPATAPTIATAPTPIRVAVATLTALAAAVAMIAMGPNLSGAITLTPNAAVTTSVSPTPTRVPGGVTQTPNAAAITSASPTATTSSAITLTPAPATITAANGPPATATTVTTTPPAAIMTSTVPAPTAFVAGSMSAQPATAISVVPTPVIVTGGVIITPPAATITTTVPSATVTAGVTIVIPATAPMTATSPPPTRSVGVATVTASPAVLTSGVGTPSATAAGMLTPAPAVLLATTPTPAIATGPVAVTAASAVLSSGVPTAQVTNTATTIPQVAILTATAPAPARQVGTATVTPPAAVMTAIQPSPSPSQTGAPQVAVVISAPAITAVASPLTLHIAVTPPAASASFIVPTPLLANVVTPTAASLSAQGASPIAIPGVAVRIPNAASVVAQAVSPVAGAIAGGERQITLIVHRAKVVELRV